MLFLIALYIYIIYNLLIRLRTEVLALYAGDFIRGVITPAYVVFLYFMGDNPNFSLKRREK